MAGHRRRHDEGAVRRGKTGPNPTDRAKSGTKRSLLTEGRGVPTGIVVDGANRVDAQLVEPTIESCPVRSPAPTPRKRQNLSLHAGYDNHEVRTLVASYGYTAHIRSRHEEAD